MNTFIVKKKDILGIYTFSFSSQRIDESFFNPKGLKKNRLYGLIKIKLGSVYGIDPKFQFIFINFNAVLEWFVWTQWSKGSRTFTFKFCDESTDYSYTLHPSTLNSVRITSSPTHDSHVVCSFWEKHPNYRPNWMP